MLFWTLMVSVMFFNVNRPGTTPRSEAERVPLKSTPSGPMPMPLPAGKVAVIEGPFLPTRLLSVKLPESSTSFSAAL